MPNIPESIAAEIAGKREPNAEGQPKDESQKDESQKDESQKDESKKTDNPEPKKGEATKPKTNGQSIAQVAEAANEDDDEDDDDEDDHDGDQKPNRKRSSLFREFLDVKRELKDTKRINKQTSQQYTELAEAMQDLIGVVKNLKGGDAQRDEIEDFAEEWGLDKEGTKALVGILEKRLSTRLKPKEKDADEDDDEQPKKKVPKAEPKAELKARQIELAIEGEYEDFMDSYPQLKDKLNLKAIKRYIIGDDENLAKSFHDVVTEMYPGILTGKAAIDGGADGDNNRDDGDKLNWNDQKVLDRLDKDPELKNKYHEDLISRVKSIRR